MLELESWADVLFWVVFALVGGTFLWKMVRHGGLRGAMFGASIRSTVGEVAGAKGAVHSTTIKVHLLEAGSAGRDIGIEFIAKGLGYQMTPATLSVRDALRLSELLQEAARRRAGA